MSKDTTRPAPAEQGSTVDASDVARRLMVLEQQSAAYNTAIIAVAKHAGVKSGSFDKETADSFIEYVESTIRPFMAKAMGVADKANEVITEREDQDAKGTGEESSEKDSEKNS